MNLATKLGSLAVIGLFSASTLAQVAVRPRLEARPETAIKPGTSTQGKGLEGRFQMQAAANENQAPQCDSGKFATALAADLPTSFYNDAKVVIDAGQISVGECASAGAGIDSLGAVSAGVDGLGVAKTGVVTYKAIARANLIEGEKCANENGAATASPEQRNNVIRPPCYVKAFANDPGAAPTTLAAAKDVVAQLAKPKPEGCGILH